MTDKTRQSAARLRQTEVQTSQINLWQLKAGQRCRIIGFDEKLDPRYQERVLELGFRPQTLVQCLRASALGAPRVYRVSSSVFSLEDSIASCIQVELV